MKVLLSTGTVRVGPRQAIGKGGEADVYRLPGGRALKLWKGPDHADLRGLPEEQAAARARIDLLQAKLPAFPVRLPSRVVAPLDLARDPASGRLMGFVMPLIDAATPLARFHDRAFRTAHASRARVTALLLDLAGTLRGLHAAGVVVGDLSDQNLLVREDAVHLIDADSLQFGAFPCPVYTARLLDPRLTDPAAPGVPARPFDPGSDWYALSALVLECLVFAGPWGGVHAPTNPADRVAPAQRPYRGLSVFHPEVRYPRPADPLASLPGPLHDHLRAVFEAGRRDPFPVDLLAGARWTRCPSCGLEHGLRSCPVCSRIRPVTGTATGGPFTVRRRVRTAGRIVHAAADGGVLRYLVLEDGALRRETGEVILTGEPPADLRYRILGPDTLLARAGQLVRIGPGGVGERLAVDRMGAEPAWATNGRHVFWVDAGQLLRDGPAGPVRVGAVLPDLTRFWVGPRFGLGFYEAGELRVGFVVDASATGIDDRVDLPRWPGALVDAQAVLSDTAGFLAWTSRHGGVRHRGVALIRRDGRVEATAEAPEDALPWLATAHLGCVAGDALFCPTDDGVVPVRAEGARLVAGPPLAGTGDPVSSSHSLLALPEGIAVISPNEIRLLQWR